MRLTGILACFVSVLIFSTQNAAAYRKCGFGIWDQGDRCERGPIICERSKFAGLDTGTKQWKCWHRKGLKWRTKKNAKMRKYHWF